MADRMRNMSLEYFERVDGFLSKPADGKSYPGVVMIHEIWGLNDHIKDTAKNLASEGYCVLAADLFGGEIMKSLDEGLKKLNGFDNDKAAENLGAAVDHLKSVEKCDRIGVLGWCFGGGQALNFALRDNRIDAAAIYYGFLVKGDKLKSLRSPVLGIFGDQDKAIPVSDVHEFKKSLDKFGIENSINIYKGVGHAFANPSNPGHDVEKTADAWKKTLAFLENYLKA